MFMVNVQELLMNHQPCGWTYLRVAGFYVRYFVEGKYGGKHFQPLPFIIQVTNQISSLLGAGRMRAVCARAMAAT